MCVTSIPPYGGGRQQSKSSNMTRRLRTNIPSTETACKHDIPTFNSPSYKFSHASVFFGEKDISEQPIYIEEDLANCEGIHIIIHDNEIIIPEEETTDTTEVMEILVYSDDDGQRIYENVEMLDDTGYSTLSLQKCIDHLHAGAYTIYLSNLRYEADGEPLFENRDNVTAFKFRILSRQEVLSEPAPHGFKFTRAGKSPSMADDSIKIEFCNHRQGTCLDFYCYNEHMVLMYEQKDLPSHITCMNMTSRHLWQRGHYTCIFDNGIIPVAAVEFDITPDGKILWKEGFNESSAAYRLTRIRECAPQTFLTMQTNICMAGDLQFTMACLEWYDRLVVNKLCERYECPKVYESAQLDDSVPLPATYNASHSMDVLYEILKEQKKLTLTPAAIEKLSKWFATEYVKTIPWDYEKACLVGIEIVKNFNKRRQEHLDDHWSDLYTFLTSIEPEDLTWDFSDNAEIEEQPTAYDEAMSDLRKMVGLEKLKSDLEKIFTHVRFNQLRESYGLPGSSNNAHHMLFYGNPGTGKTTVAKHIGKIFHAMGLLTDGDVIVTDRSNLVGRYLGETETNMKELLEEAEGKVLFIDEAYSLFVNDSERSDFGHRVIESLLPKMAEENPNMLIIMAGYEDELNNMVKINPGLRGRFAHKIHFDDYSADELTRIAQLVIKQDRYELDETAKDYLHDTITEAVAHKSRLFGNARWVGQYVHNGILPAMAERVMTSGNADERTCQLILKSDIEKAWEEYAPKESGNVQIGFLLPGVQKEKNPKK